MYRWTFSLPLYSIIPAGLGILMVWAVFTIFSLLGFTHCVSWSFLQSASMKDVRIIGTLKNSLYLQAQDGTIYCNAQSQWKKCSVSTFVLSRKDAPAWLNSRFTSIPEESEVTQLTLAGNYYSGNTYFALLENDQI